MQYLLLEQKEKYVVYLSQGKRNCLYVKKGLKKDFSLKTLSYEETCKFIETADGTNSIKISKNMSAKTYEEFIADFCKNNKQYFLEKDGENLNRSSRFIESCRAKLGVLSPQEKPIPEQIYNNLVFLLETLIKTQAYKLEALFRREGKKKWVDKIYLALFNSKNIEVEFKECFTSDLKYAAVTAIKRFIRDDLDGLFLSDTLCSLYNSIVSKKDSLEISNLSLLIIHSHSIKRQKILFLLKNLIDLISQNSAKNKMTEESIANILSLTLIPQRFFTNINDAAICNTMYKNIINNAKENNEERIFKIICD
ncbi:hypothetical protein NUSPORA_00867 [Nucleospora cyclopteri]